MSIARDLARLMFGRSIEIIDLKIAFYKDANLYGTHGHLTASHFDKGLKNCAVRFVFIGLSDPPAMTPRIAEYIWEEAKAQGYIPTAISSYGSVLETHSNLPPRALISNERRSVEDFNSYGRVPSLEETAALAVAAAGGHELTMDASGKLQHFGVLSSVTNSNGTKPRY